jgi:hypothetical protein
MVMRKRALSRCLLVWCLVAAGSVPVVAQTQLFVTDYFKQSGYTNVAAEGSVTPATSPVKLFEIMITPLFEAFRICLWTATEASARNPNQEEVFAKKMKWEAFGDQSGDRLGKGTVKTRAGQVRCKDVVGFDASSTAAEEDNFIFWFAEFQMKGNREFEGYFGPAIWTFPFAPSAAAFEPIAAGETLVMTREEFEVMRRKLVSGGGALTVPSLGREF